MHELSIALGIVKIAEDETAKAKAKKVTKIETTSMAADRLLK